MAVHTGGEQNASSTDKFETLKSFFDQSFVKKNFKLAMVETVENT